MARLEFESCKQGGNEPISSYLTKKMSLYRSYSPQDKLDDQTWNYFLRETLSGVYSTGASKIHFGAISIGGKICLVTFSRTKITLVAFSSTKIAFLAIISTKTMKLNKKITSMIGLYNTKSYSLVLKNLLLIYYNRL